MSEKLTQEQVTAYVEDGGGHCPHCGSGSIEATESPKVETGAAYQVITCLDCGRQWTDGYTLDRVGCGDGDDFEFVGRKGLRLIVELRGGLVQAGYADADVFDEVDVLDWDCVGAGAEGDAEDRNHANQLAAEIKDLQEVF